MSQALPEGIKIEIRKTNCYGDTLMRELTSCGQVSNGRNYENEYCFVFELENDKIRRMREYVDPQRAKDLPFS